ncbi:MAG: Tn3 family transposase [Cycloclasticus sp.]|nr:Tn3 family transposase [Cycloclasticus sp.]|tara:strand:- start:1143 stop:4187 length:3045 start_codon:yes stop_codon:yes gene_type:complete
MTTTQIIPYSISSRFQRPPKFTAEERRAFFFITPAIRKVLPRKSAIHKVGFVLQLGYFSATRQFYSTEHVRNKDKGFIEKMLGIKTPVDLSSYTQSIQKQHRAKIRTLFNWHIATPEDRLALQDHAFNFANKRMPAEQQFFQLVSICWKRQFDIPNFKTLQNYINEGYLKFESRLIASFSTHFDDNQQQLVSNICQTADDAKILLNKKYDHSDSTRHFWKNISLLENYRAYHAAVLPTLSKLNLYDESFRFFAKWIKEATLRQILSMHKKGNASLRVLCFIREEYYQRNDYACYSFIKEIKSCITRGKRSQKIENEEQEEAFAEQAITVIDYAKTADAIIKLVYKVQKNPSVSFAEKHTQTLDHIDRYLEAINPEIMTTTDRLNNKLTGNTASINYYLSLEKDAEKVLRKYRSMLKVIEFDEKYSDNNIIQAIKHYNQSNGKYTEDLPLYFLKKSEKTQLFENNIKNMKLYNMLFMVEVCEALRSRRLCLKYSFNHLPEEHYGITRSEFEEDEDHILELANLEGFKDIGGILKKKREAVDAAFKNVNEGLINGENPHLKFTKKGYWHINTPKTDYDITKVIPGLLGDNGSVTLSKVIREVDEFIGFSELFKHSHIVGSKKKVPSELMYAVIVSLGCNISFRQMANACGSSITESKLQHANDWLFSKECIKNANNLIVEEINSLSLPNIFKLNPDTDHASSDGAKITVAVNSILANFSFKYYGKESGVVANSFINEKSAFFHANIQSSTDREALYMLDAYSGNSVVKSNNPSHSGDSHVYTDAIFGATDMFKISLAPRIANAGRQVLRGFSRSQVKKRNSHEIAPTGVINTKLIKRNWKEMLRTIASISLGRASASETFDRLARSEKQNELYRAFKEYGRINKTIFLLEYFDNIELRQRIEKMLSLVELGQKLFRAVFNGRQGKLYQSEPEDMERVILCTTLIRNIIICWNYIVLSDIIIDAPPNEQRFLIESISKGSVLSWAHINMFGEFDYSSRYKSSIKADINTIRKFKVPT